MKRFTSFVLIFVLVLSFSISSLGAVASGSVASRSVASSSNAIRFQTLSDVVTYADTVLPTVTNTVSFDDSVAQVGYTASDGEVYYLKYELSRYGNFTIPQPDGTPTSIGFIIYSLPVAGKYQLSVRFSSNTGGFDYYRIYLYSQSERKNAQNSSTSWYNVDFSENSGDFYFTTTYEVTSATSALYIIVYPNTYYFPFGGQLYINFTPISDDSSVAVVGNETDSGYTQEIISDNVSAISSSLDTVNDTLYEIVQTISNQLEAFWLQLYGLIYEPWVANDNANTTKITNAVDSIGIDIVDSVDSASEDITDSISDMQDAVIQNQNDNTNSILYDYDNSSIISDNERLSSTFEEYESVESDITDEITDYINDFTFPDWSDLLNTGGIVSAITFFGVYMQNIYNAMGSFNVQITVSLTLIFVLMLIGYHRFKI